jgi:hypothetical protein
VREKERKIEKKRDREKERKKERKRERERERKREREEFSHKDPSRFENCKCGSLAHICVYPFDFIVRNSPPLQLVFRLVLFLFSLDFLLSHKLCHGIGRVGGREVG